MRTSMRPTFPDWSSDDDAAATDHRAQGPFTPPQGPAVGYGRPDEADRELQEALMQLPSLGALSESETGDDGVPGDSASDASGHVGPTLIFSKVDYGTGSLDTAKPRPVAPPAATGRTHEVRAGAERVRGSPRRPADGPRAGRFSNENSAPSSPPGWTMRPPRAAAKAPGTRSVSAAFGAPAPLQAPNRDAPAAAAARDVAEPAAPPVRVVASHSVGVGMDDDGGPGGFTGGGVTVDAAPPAADKQPAAVSRGTSPAEPPASDARPAGAAATLAAGEEDAGGGARLLERRQGFSLSLEETVGRLDLDGLIARLQAGQVDLSGRAQSTLPPAESLWSDDDDDAARDKYGARYLEDAAADGATPPRSREEEAQHRRRQERDAERAARRRRFLTVDGVLERVLGQPGFARVGSKAGPADRGGGADVDASSPPLSPPAADVNFEHADALIDTSRPWFAQIEPRSPAPAPGPAPREVARAHRRALYPAKPGHTPEQSPRGAAGAAGPPVRVTAEGTRVIDLTRGARATAPEASADPPPSQAPVRRRRRDARGMGALYAAGATSSSATSSSSENSDASAGSSSEDEGLWAATRQRVKRAAGGARRPKRTLRRKRVSVSRSRSPTPPRRTRHEPQAVKWEDVREGMLRDVPGLPRGPTRAEIEAAEAERAAAEAAEQRLAAARRELREERRRERIAAAAAAAAGGRAEGEDVVRSAQDAALRQHAERRVRSREGAWGKALAGAAGGAALLFEPGVSFGPAIPSLPGDVDAARVVAVHFAVPHKRLLPGVLRLMTSGGYNRATRGGARFEDHALTVIGAQLCADAQPGGPAPTRLLVAVAVGAPGVPATAAARQLSAQLAGASLAGCGATHGPDATGPSVGALVDAVVAGPGDFCRELAMWHSPPGDEACGDPTLAVAVARVGAAGGAGWAWEALCLALERAMADGLDVCGLRTCYHAASDAQAAAAAAGKRARHPALMPPPAPGRATAPGPDVAVAVRGPAAGARWMALLGPHVPSVARVTDPASVNAALPGECDHSPLTSIYDAATAAAEAVWLFGGRVDAAADPAAWLAQRADAATTAAAPPTPPPAIAQPTCAPQRGGLLSGLRAKAAAAEETNHAPAPTRTSSLRPLAALCCAPASRCAILAPADSPSDLRACSAALGALGATGFACEALSVVHVPDDAAAGELLCGVRGTGHAVWLAASGGDGVQRTAAAPSDIAGRRVAVGVFARAGAAAWAEDAAAEAARRAAAATGGEVRVAALLSASAGPAVAGKGRWPAAAPVDAPLRLATRRPAPHESDALLTSVAAFRAAHGLPTVEDAARVPHAPEIALAAVAAPAHRLADAATAVQNILETLCAATGGAAPLRVLGVRLEPDIRNAVQRHLHPVPHGHAAAIAAGSLHALHGPHVLVALQGVDAHKRLRGVAEEHAGIAAVSGGPVDGLAAAARAFCASELATPSGGESVAEVLAGGRPTTAACLVAAPSGAAGAAARALPRVLRAMHRLGFTLRGMKHVREGVFSGDGGHAVLLCASRQGAASCLQAALADGSGTSASGLLGVAARMVPWAGSWEAMGRRFESAPQGGCGAVWEERLEAMRGEGGDSRLLQASVLSVACCDADAVPEGAVQRRGADAMDGAELSDVAGCIETLVEAGFTLLDTRLTNGTLMARRARATPGRTSTSPDRPTLHLVVGRDNAVAGLGMRLQQAQQRAGAHGHSSDPLADVVRFAACAADAAEAREWLARLERGQA